MTTKKRGFRLTPEQQAFADGAKVKTADTDEAAKPPETPAEAAKASKTPDPLPDTPESPPGAAESVPAAKKPWEDLSAGGKGVNVPMSPELYAKMKWVTENVPKMSLQKIARLGAEAECDRLIAQFYKP